MATLEANKVDLVKMDKKDRFLTYGNQWAQVAMGPFRDYKGYTDCGEIRLPSLIIGPIIEGPTHKYLSFRKRLYV